MCPLTIITIQACQSPYLLPAPPYDVLTIFRLSTRPIEIHSNISVYQPAYDSRDVYFLIDIEVNEFFLEITCLAVNEDM